jgi:hypothetical protein
MKGKRYRPLPALTYAWFSGGSDKGKKAEWVSVRRGRVFGEIDFGFIIKFRLIMENIPFLKA